MEIYRIKNVNKFNNVSCNQLSKLRNKILTFLKTKSSKCHKSFSNTHSQLSKVLNYNQLSELILIQIPKHFLKQSLAATMGKFYETFNGCNLRIFVISQSVCPCKLFHPSLMFVGKARSLPQTGATERCFPQTLDQAEKAFQGQGLQACIIKLLTAVIYGFRHKLECFSLNNRPGWKCFPGTNTLAYYRNRELRP